MSRPLPLDAYPQRVDAFLTTHLPLVETDATPLHQAISYAVLNGGKRLRAMLVYCTGTIFKVPLEQLDPLAAAVELIHSYSLVHDDLPAMDNDDLRRGKPSCHIAFGEATAILVGDALQTLALQMIVHHTACAHEQKMLRVLLDACSHKGLVGGQAIDLALTGQPASIEQVEEMHRLKTGALIKASVLLGALASDRIDAPTLDALARYSDHIGLAFQIHDDVLDVEATTDTLGKPQGTDIALNKATYPAVAGLQTAKKRVIALHTAALDQLHNLPKHSTLPLRTLTDYMISRHY